MSTKPQRTDLLSLWEAKEKTNINHLSAPQHKALGSSINTDNMWCWKCVERMCQTVAQAHNNMTKMCSTVRSSPKRVIVSIIFAVTNCGGTPWPWTQHLLSSAPCALSSVSAAACFHYCCCLWGSMTKETKEYTSSHSCNVMSYRFLKSEIKISTSGPLCGVYFCGHRNTFGLLMWPCKSFNEFF